VKPNGPVEWALLIGAGAIIGHGEITHSLTWQDLAAAAFLLGLIWPRRVDQAMKEIRRK
jgi:membrane-bound metal-dependent hydrolase YbcI (DUF457 family)